ncbi:MAG: altronate hydrolase, partial [Chloroflexi bacterium]
PHIDGVVAVAHTEGSHPNPNNRKLLLRTLAGFMVNPNVGAVLAVDYGIEPVTNAMLRAWLEDHDYPLDDVPHAFLSLSGGFQEGLAQGEAIVRNWLEQVNATVRTPESVAHLKLALQCGGSDAFSGISGNPLLGWVAHEVIRHGGAANLAETDELIGAESYVLQQVRDRATAERFLQMIERFKEYASWHGASAEGNPSGGNKYRGLYNITLKSIGAAMKKDPRTRLDYAIDYGVRMVQPGYYFMDSPGNDLESIAGQVATGANLIFFVTGNGSVTNFPFVPTIKIVTTTRRTPAPISMACLWTNWGNRPLT